MSRPFVPDASIAIGWVHPGQSTPDSDAMLDAIAAGSLLEVPGIWPLEVANAVITLQRRRKLTAGEARTALEMIALLPVKVDGETSSIAFTTLVELAVSHGLSVYDAAYLELAKRRGLALATQDAQLRRAAVKSDVELWIREE